VLSGSAQNEGLVRSCKALGAPVVFVCSGEMLEWWKQGSDSVSLLERIPTTQIARFFYDHRFEFAPEAVYRAKNWGRFRQEYQLSFVDFGLMPLVEEEVGQALGRLIENNVGELKQALGWSRISDQQGHWLLSSIFWLISAKILRDKGVTNFKTVDLSDVQDVFARLGRHYGTRPISTTPVPRLRALEAISTVIERHSSLALTTTEALAYVYENTLISKETRSSLGTHSTPSFLVDFIVSSLAEWIAEIPVDARNVFEPACGHAAFLVSAMRLLIELLPPDMTTPSMRGPYLRKRLHGVDIDHFALELARLSLTLTDIPNPNGWDLRVEDVFVGNRLAENVQKRTIVLANPPFENFTEKEKSNYAQRGHDVSYRNKAIQVLAETLKALPNDGVVGMVLPQSVLNSKGANELRRSLGRDYELRDIALFPDKMFAFSDAESAVIVARHRVSQGTNTVYYRQIREPDFQTFRSGLHKSISRAVSQSRFSVEPTCSFRLPELEEVWRSLQQSPKLSDLCDVGQGFTFEGEHLPRGVVTYSTAKKPGCVKGFVHFDRDVELTGLPTEYWVNLSQEVIGRPRSGAQVKIPQVLLNYAPVTRGPWRLKALIDRQGHAVTTRFITIRPRNDFATIEALWAILNSPVANAFAFTHLGKRDNTVGVIRTFPMPDMSSLGRLGTQVRAYFNAASSKSDGNSLRNLLLAIDAEVLKSYSIALDTESALLQIFSGARRLGVPFVQSGYIPDQLAGRVRLAEFLELEQDWESTNAERGTLIEKKIQNVLTPEEGARFELLQSYADYHLERVAPRPTEFLQEFEAALTRRKMEKTRA
jgi:type I restriction-modification system DNA methylase subunit